jgi:molybdopterin synthase catalytic subunit
MSVPLARVTEEPIEVAEAEAAVLTDADGALVTFRGVVRDADDGRAVTALDYSAHPEAERFLRESCERIAAARGLTVAAVHRTGPLRVGDVALVAVVASPHRAEAFTACAELVDDIKTSVPIWKRQYYPEGVSDWVGL